jgi:hypothetical protein
MTSMGSTTPGGSSTTPDYARRRSQGCALMPMQPRSATSTTRLAWSGSTSTRTTGMTARCTPAMCAAVKKQNAQVAPAVDPALADAVRVELRTQLGEEGFEAWRRSTFALRDVLVEEEVADYAGQLDGDPGHEPVPAPPRLAHARRRADDAFARLARYTWRADTRPRRVAPLERDREPRHQNVRRGPRRARAPARPSGDDDPDADALASACPLAGACGWRAAW